MFGNFLILWGIFFDRELLFMFKIFNLIKFIIEEGILFVKWFCLSDKVFSFVRFLILFGIFLIRKFWFKFRNCNFFRLFIEELSVLIKELLFILRYFKFFRKNKFWGMELLKWFIFMFKWISLVNFLNLEDGILFLRMRLDDMLRIIKFDILKRGFKIYERIIFFLVIFISEGMR